MSGGPFRAAPPLPPGVFAEVRRRTIFEACKWDPQVGDVAVLAEFPLVLEPAAWSELAVLAEALGRETLAAEAELVARPELQRRLGLPWSVRRALRRAATDGAPPGAARFMRFDFHDTPDGWRISEVNSDVPGGWNEASGFAGIVAGHYPDLAPTGDPAGALADAAVRATGAGGETALLHATAYSDDHQVMAFLGGRIVERGGRIRLCSPGQLDWRDGRAHLVGNGARPFDLLLRFFPAEWLPNLPRGAGWRRHFAGGRTPAANPATAVLTQSKRFPVVWDELRTPLPTWRALLPETRDPRGIEPHDESWVFKPALGRVGEGIGLVGATSARDWRAIRRELHRRPGSWVAQRRFVVRPLAAPGGPVRVCLGVYVVDGRACGVYGRLARGPLIDAGAREAAVLLPRAAGAGKEGP
ncbi:MAG: glutathionylspermidine synthase family protein [Deltaproteobacteria bacterium]|nr:glutathionylspermidine synthase family protein [Deltaproteobacteria bacterium]